MENLPVKLLRNIQRKDGRNEIKTYPYHRCDISCPFLHRPLFGILISGEDDDSSNSYSPVYSGMNLSADVLKHQTW